MTCQSWTLSDKIKVGKGGITRDMIVYILGQTNNNKADKVLNLIHFKAVLSLNLER